MTPTGFMVAAPRSGSGKTTVALGLMRALLRRGLRVAPFKCGPDYIDPAFHGLASGRACMNLDSWAMSEAWLDSIFARGAKDADIAVVEGSMGLFDGVASAGESGCGASADIAAYFGLPVVLVIDVGGMSQSAGAVAAGFAAFSPQVRIAGVILNNVAGERHRSLAARGVECAGLPVLGALPRGGVPKVPERHLGLVQATEMENTSHLIDTVAEAIENYVDIPGLLSLTRPVRVRAHATPPYSAPVQHIAVASDIAFSFLYPQMLAEWREKGAEILPFSPLADEAPDASAEMCWLPGGYPELHAARLSRNSVFMNGLRAFAAQKPVHGECGGYMVLGSALVDAEGGTWPMAGLLPLTTSFAVRKLQMGYRSLVFPDGRRWRGHEFHYAQITQQGASEPLGEMYDADEKSLGPAGQRAGNVSGTFFHRVSGIFP